MNDAFFDGLDELYHHAKFREDRTTPAVGAKTWCLYVFFTGRIAAKRQTAGIVFTQRPKKTTFSPLWGDSLHRFM